MAQCCIDHSGNPKKKYASKDEAERVAELRRDEGVGIKVYQCEDGDGWHLTSQNVPPPERPTKVMTVQDRQLYSQKPQNRLGSIIGQDLETKIRDTIHTGTISPLEDSVRLLNRAVVEKYQLIQSYKREIDRLGAAMLITTRELGSTRRDLKNATDKLNAAKRRIQVKNQGKF